MRTSKRAVLICAIGAGLIAAAAGVTAAGDDDQALLARAQGIFKPLPADAGTPQRPITPERVELGRALFFETRVSTDGRQSCAACHNPHFYGGDALPQSVGNGGRELPRNVPTVFNTALQFVQHYGGNRVDVEEQAVKALISGLAYGNKDYAEAERRLRALPYREMFEKAFPGQAEPVNVENWGLAIGAYERVLITPAPFDKYLQGDTGAISEQAKRGLDTFMTTGCAACHSGTLVGGGMFQKFGITADYWTATGRK